MQWNSGVMFLFSCRFSPLPSDSYDLGLSAVIKDYSIYGRIPARQNSYVGNYSDTIIVTVNYL